MTVINYQDVFGVPLGDEVQEAHGVTYRPCPAVDSLRGELLAIPFFRASKVGGMGPLFRLPGFKHEFNRHHAGLAVDIMLNPASDDEEALGHHLVMLFVQAANVMNWRGMIYQDITVDLNGATRTATVSRKFLCTELRQMVAGWCRWSRWRGIASPKISSGRRNP